MSFIWLEKKRKVDKREKKKKSERKTRWQIKIVHAYNVQCIVEDLSDFSWPKHNNTKLTREDSYFVLSLLPFYSLRQLRFISIQFILIRILWISWNSMLFTICHLPFCCVPVHFVHLFRQKSTASNQQSTINCQLTKTMDKQRNAFFFLLNID